MEINSIAEKKIKEYISFLSIDKDNKIILLDKLHNTKVELCNNSEYNYIKYELTNALMNSRFVDIIKKWWIDK